MILHRLLSLPIAAVLCAAASGQVVPPMHGPGLALAFNGANQHASTLAAPIIIGPAITVEAWIYAGAFNYGEVYALCDDPNSACTGVDYKYLGLRITPTGRVEFALAPVNFSARRIYVTSLWSISLNTWTHVAATLDLGANSWSIYINGVAAPTSDLNVGSGAGSFTGSPAIGALQVSGASTGVQYPFTGQIDELRVWSTVVSQASIRDFMCRNDLTGHPDLASLQALYHVEEPGPNTTTVWDHVGNHHGTLQNVSVASAYVPSDAALGDVSVHTYTGTNLALTVPGENLLTSTAGVVERHIYHVSPPGSQVDGTMPSGLDAAGGGCFGVFLVNPSPGTYLLNYTYTGNPEIDGTPAEPNAVLLWRNQPSASSWTQHSPQYLNTSFNVIDLQGTWPQHRQWAGAYTPVPCDTWTLTINTDSAGNQTTWQMVDANSPFILDSGGPYPNNAAINESICVPQGACFDLIFNDSGNNGITPGGWVLTDNNGRRVIDNFGNGAAFTSSAQPNQEFCSPVSTRALTVASCDELDWLSNEYIVASPDPAVSAQWLIGNQTDDGYQFWFFNPVGGYTRRILHSHAVSMGFGPASATRACHVPLSFTTLPIPFNTLLNVRVRSLVNGVYGDFGPACRFMLLPAPPACPSTQLDNNALHAGTTLSCGVTGKVVGSSGYSGKLWANIVSGATHYRWRFAVASEGYTRVITTSTYHVTLGTWVTNPLLCGTFTYDVDVAVSMDNAASFCPYGVVCTAGITNNAPNPCTAPFQGGGSSLNATMEDGAVFNMWPNPNRGDQLSLSLSEVEEGVTQVYVEVYDLFGKRVHQEAIATDAGFTAVIELKSTLASGLYTVNVVAGSRTYVERLVIQ